MASCPSKASASPKQDRSAGGSESFDSVAKRLLTQADPVSQVDMSAAANGQSASVTSELVTPASDLAQASQSTKPFAHQELGRGNADAELNGQAETVAEFDSQRDAVLLSGYPLVTQPIDTGNHSPSAVDLDATQASIDVNASTDAASSDVGTAVGTVETDAAANNTPVDDDFPSAVAEEGIDSVTDGPVTDGPVASLAAGSEASFDSPRHGVADAEGPRSAEHDASASEVFDSADVANDVPQNAAELPGVVAASNEQERAAANVADPLAIDAARNRSVDPTGQASTSAAATESTTGAVETPIAATDPTFGKTADGLTGESAEGADAMQATGASDHALPVIEGDVVVDQAAMTDAVDQDASASRSTEQVNDVPPQTAATSAAEVAGETASDSAQTHAPAVNAAKQATEMIDDAADPVEFDDSGDRSTDSILQDSLPIESGGAAEFGDRQSRRGSPFEPIVSAELADSNPLTNESPAIVPMDGPIDVGMDAVVDQEIFDTLSLEEFIQSSPASPEAVKKTAEVIHEAMRTSLQLDGQTVRLEVHPAELGTLKIHVTQTDQAIETQIIATEYVTSELLLSHRDQLMDALADAGFEASDVNISYQEQSSGESEGQQRPSDHRYQSKSQTQSIVSRESVSGGGVNIVA
ncbi:flagellar hook-length control protein FliK [Stieleria mannarensis]|uniref:flagellar hook-length control protein FliK n=1 Tax=Stieleria mannarensis TaxID=2755585 RepID=UPI001600D42F|nr:flagellar hook-length control protein FliK [Rhodopirellula sp. JC639]